MLNDYILKEVTTLLIPFLPYFEEDFAAVTAFHDVEGLLEVVEREAVCDDW